MHWWELPLSPGPLEGVRLVPTTGILAKSAVATLFIDFSDFRQFQRYRMGQVETIISQLSC